MAKKADPCIDAIRQAGGDKITVAQAQEIIDDIMNRADRIDMAKMGNVENKIKEIGSSILDQNKISKEIQKRNAILIVTAQRRIRDYVSRFPTAGEGLQAFNEGATGRARTTRGARLSVDSQVIALKHKFTGDFLNELETAGLVGDFVSNRLEREIFQELWHINDPNAHNPSGNKNAKQLAQIIRRLQNEMVDRENRAGAYIGRLDNYVIRQTHDATAIRKAGGMGMGRGSNEASFQAWKEFITPLLDEELTFKDMVPEEFLREAHRGIITGVHHRSPISAGQEFVPTGSLARKISQRRVLHFKDADSSFAYNSRFGARNLRDGVIGDIKRSSHAIGLLENYGPNPENTFRALVDEFKQVARTLPDDREQLLRLDSPNLQASFDEIMGRHDIPHNMTLHRVTRALRDWQTLSKLGGVTLSAIPDKAFFHMAGTYQGMKSLDIWREQLGIFIPKTAEEKEIIRAMGAGIDAFLGEVATRFTATEKVGGTMFKLQQNLFKLNVMNWWNDVHKGAFAKLTAITLGEHGKFDHGQLNDDLRNLLNIYDINAPDWNLLRSHTYDVGGRTYLTPDRVNEIPESRIISELETRGIGVSDGNIRRFRDQLETKLRALISDQVDDAIPTPGGRERRLSYWNTEPGTARGAAARLLMHFKSFPITVWERAVKREVYGHGSKSVKQWLLSDRKGNFRMLQLIALTTIGGYISMSIKDALRGRKPRRLKNDDGSFNADVVLAAMKRGGGLGIYGDFLFTEYDRSYSSVVNVMAGPVVGTASEVIGTASQGIRGKDITRPAEKLALGNTPFINLFYIRPVLDYLILWNIEEMLNPGSLTRMEKSVEKHNHQGFLVRPSEVVR